MYLPRSFEETDAATLHAFVRAHPLGTLITTAQGELCADHIPFLSGDEGTRMVLRGHVARANPLWRHIESQPDVLVVFQDAGRYITPSWYATKKESGQVVPTWNYAAVHVAGRARAIQDATWLHAFLTRLTSLHEARQPEPWQLSDAPAEYIANQLRAIVGIEISIARLTGKWKMSQNRQPQDIDGVIEGLRAATDPDSIRMADEIARRRPY